MQRNSYVICSGSTQEGLTNLCLVYIIRMFIWSVGLIGKLSSKKNVPSILISIRQGQTPEFLIVDESQPSCIEVAENLGWLSLKRRI